MYQVVIIDDEPIIVTGLTQAIQWSKWDCEVAGSAADGEEGLALIRKLQPDIVFTDISMPNMNGLVMIAGLKSQFPDTHVTILTGFRDFEYAREAIRLGVDRFLLKPSKMAELEEALDYMVAQLREEDASRAGAAAGARDTAADAVAEAAPAEADLQSGSDDDHPVSAESAASNFIVTHALEYISDHYAEKVRLSDVADSVYVSQWHLSKLLNAITGKGFSEILNGIRIERAKELLKNPAYRIGDVAEKVGFNDLAHFSRVFKKETGMSANEYRNRF